MKNILFSCAILLFSFSSCLKERNLSNEVHGFSQSQNLIESANLQFVETIAFYDARINYTDSLHSRVKSSINTNKVIDQYTNALLLFEGINITPKLKIELISNLNILVDTIVGKSIEIDYKPWNKIYLELKNSVISIEENLKKSAFLDINQLRLEMELIYNMVFQLLMRHKIEEEFTNDIIYPIVSKDIKLDDGTREVTIHACVGNVNDGQSLEIYFGDKRLDVFEGIATTIYKPDNLHDSVILKVVSDIYVNGERSVAEAVYELKK